MTSINIVVIYEKAFFSDLSRDYSNQSLNQLNRFITMLTNR